MDLEDLQVEVSVDLAPLSEYFGEAHALNELFFGPNRTYDLFEMRRSLERQGRPRVVNATVACGVPLDAFYAESVLDLFLTNLFFAMNVAVPGCAAFDSVVVLPKKGDPGSDPLGLGAWFLADARSLADEYEWPCLTSVPFEVVWRWLKGCGFRNCQLARTALERAVFSFLHACREEEVPPVTLIWLVHALEALFDTPSEGVVRTLRDRMFALHGFPVNNRKLIKKELERMYNLRSRFVHGDLGIAHPLDNDALDYRVNKSFEDFGVRVDLAFALVLATFQRMASEEWIGLSFTETFTGHGLETVLDEPAVSN